MGAITTHCPNARLVLDRFHVVKALNDAIDEVRKEQWREASAAHRKALKGLTGIHPLDAVTRRLSGRWRNTTGEWAVELQRPVGGTAILQPMDHLRLA